MPSRRTVVTSALGLGIAAALGYLFRANHTIPPTDLAAEAAFRDAQRRALGRYGVQAQSREVELAAPRLKAHVLETGAGAPLVFLHGGNSVAAGWIPLLARLPEYRCSAPDRPGCGLTTKFNYLGVPLREHASAFVGGVLDALGIERAALIGNSMGGYFALAFALAHPERVTKLVLMGEPAGSAPRIRAANRLVGTRIANAALFATVLKPGPATLRNSLRNMLVAHPERIADELVDCLTAGAVIPGAAESWITLNESIFDPQGAGLFFAASTLTYALRPELGRLQPPTLMLWGDRDTFGRPALGEEMARLMPAGRCEIVPDAGHLPWLDDTELCARRVREFIG